MCGLRRGIASAEPWQLLARLGLLGLAMGAALALSGCATAPIDQTSSTSLSHASSTRIGVEDGRLRAQIASMATARNEPGDLSQPFSRSNGQSLVTRLFGPPTRLSNAEVD